MIHFAKYHGLGNDYLVIEPDQFDGPPTVEQIKRICDRHYGVGSDGILLGPLPTETAEFGLRIFNPDGSEAEKSGNGLRIFSRYLWDTGRLKTAEADPAGPASQPFTVQTPGGLVRSQVFAGGASVTVEMGRASFNSRLIQMLGPEREVIGEHMVVSSQDLLYCAVSMGNPHCVVFCKQISPELAHMLGPLVENEPRFPKRTNVQFLQPLDRHNLRIEIWERGAGYTLASGSSSCAAAAAAHRMGLCDAAVEVHNPGGIIQVEIAPDWSITMRGPVEKVFEGQCEV